MNQYPQLDNLYPAPSESQPGSQPQQGQQKPPQPAAGPGAGFARPPPTHQVPFGGNNGGFANYSAVGGSSGRSHGGGHDAGEKNVAQLIVDKSNAFQRTYQTLLDRSTPLTVQRWCATGGLLVLFALIVVIRQGWYIVCYALAIYLLNLFLAFLQPKFDPSIQQDLAQDDVEEGAPGLPNGNAASSSSNSNAGLSGLLRNLTHTSSTPNDDQDEFRPFIRRLPEFKFWLSATKATLIALATTVTRATDIPVYWPILLIYFFTLFGLTMRRQIQHMIKYRYIPFDLGRKATYGGRR